MCILTTIEIGCIKDDSFQLLRVRTLVYCYAYGYLVSDLVRRLLFGT